MASGSPGDPHGSRADPPWIPLNIGGLESSRAASNPHKELDKESATGRRSEGSYVKKLFTDEDTVLNRLAAHAQEHT